MTRLFALERYDAQHGLAAGPLGALPAGARLVAAVHLADDDVVLALVEGPDEDTVAALAAAGGWRVDRITRAAWIGPPVCPCLGGSA